MKRLWLKYKKYGWLIVTFYLLKGVIYSALIVWAWINTTQ